jgi:hypothetical protein
MESGPRKHIFMNISNLPIRIINHYTEPPPRQKLALACEVTNPATFDICLLDAWIRVEALNGLTLAEGKLFQSMYNRVDPAIIRAGKYGSGAIHIELPVNVMNNIEQRRAGGDIDLRLSSRILVSEVSSTQAGTTLKPPYETEFGDGSTSYIEYVIHQSEWVKLLRNLGWSELEIIELPSNRLRSIPPLARALERFEEARQNYRNGDWEETMFNCRKAFEAIVQDVSGVTGMGKAHQVFVSVLGEGEKTDKFDKLVMVLGDFQQLGRHENLPRISINRADAELSLFLTGALLSYLGQQ